MCVFDPSSDLHLKHFRSVRTPNCVECQETSSSGKEGAFSSVLCDRFQSVSTSRQAGHQAAAVTPLTCTRLPASTPVSSVYSGKTDGVQVDSQPPRAPLTARFSLPPSTTAAFAN